MSMGTKWNIIFFEHFTTNDVLGLLVILDQKIPISFLSQLFSFQHLFLLRKLLASSVCAISNFLNSSLEILLFFE